MSSRNRRTQMRRSRLRQRILDCRTEECRQSAIKAEAVQAEADRAQASREKLAQIQKESGLPEQECFTVPSGEKICRLKGSDDKFKGEDKKTKLLSFDTFKKNIKNEFKTFEEGTVLTLQLAKKPLTKEGRGEIFQFVLDNENKVRAAIVIADAISLGLIAAGGIATATGFGAPVGAGLAAAGLTIGVGSSKVESLVDKGLLTIKKIKQLEDAVEVAKQTLQAKTDKELLEGVVEPKVGKSLIGRDREEKIKEQEKAIKELEKQLAKIKKEKQEDEEKAEEEVGTTPLLGTKTPSGKPKPPTQPPIESTITDTKGKPKPPSPRDPIVSTLGLDISEPSDTLVATRVNIRGDEPAQAFEFSNVDNETIINQATRRPLQAAMKTDAVNKVINFTNPSKLTEAQTQGKKSDGTADKQKAALINANSDRNIYNDMVRDITNAPDCGEWLSNNIAKITILPEDLKQELRDYCESIMDDDEETEEISQELP